MENVIEKNGNKINLGETLIESFNNQIKEQLKTYKIKEYLSDHELLSDGIAILSDN